MQTKTDIIAYYDNAEVAYKDIWHLDDCLSLHYGFWMPDVKNLKQALIKEIEVLANHVNINENDVVLDAGCGIGGSTVFLAKQKHCNVHGVTLSQKQVATAKNAAQINNVSKLVHFHEADYHKTPFDSKFFSVVWFVESFGYSDDISLLLCEMFRVLDNKGRLIIADGFADKTFYSNKEKNIMNQWLSNWSINNIESLNVVVKAIEDAGFKNVKYIDYTSKIKKSAFIMYFYAMLALTYGKLCKLFGKKYGNAITLKNTIGAKYQYIALKNKLWKYYVITAEKI